MTPPVSLGPKSNLTYPAVAGGKFPGDDIGASATAASVATVWCLSSPPPRPTEVYHQTMWAAELRP